MYLSNVLSLPKFYGCHGNYGKEGKKEKQIVIFLKDIISWLLEIKL